MEGKISKPELPDLFVERKRLKDKLDRTKKFVFISGEAGAGKTLLASSMCGSPAVWFSFDEYDSDFMNFLGTFALSIRKNLSITIPVDKIMRGGNAFPMMLNTVLKIFYGLENVNIVFDNLHSIEENSKTFSFVSRLFRYAPNSAKFIFTSRKHPPAFVIRYTDRGEIISKEEIAFTLSEIKELMRKLKLPPEKAEEIMSLSKGWVMGTLLIAYELKKRGKISKNYTFEFLLGEVFEKLSKKEKDFLIKTAIFDTIYPSVLKDALKIKNPQTMLEKLMGKGLFIEKFGDYYRYHPLFREFLIKEGKEKFASQKIYSNLARYYEKRNDWKNALKYFSLAEETDKTVKILERAKPYDLITFSNLAIKAINTLPEKNDHMVQLLGALHVLRGEISAAYAIYEKYKTENPKFNELTTLKWRLLAESGKYEKIISEYEQFKEKIEKLPIEEKADLLYFTVESHYYRGNRKFAENTIENIYKEMKKTNSIVQFTRIANAYCVINFHNKGKLKEAEKIYEEIIAATETSNIAPLPIVLSNLSLIEIALGKLDKAKSRIETAIRMGIESGNKRDLKFALIAKGHYLIAAKEYKKAIGLLIKHIGEENPYLRSSAYYGLANAYRKIGELDKAEYFAKLDCETTKQMHSALLVAQSLINRGIILLTKKSFTEAEIALKEGLEKAKKSGNIYEAARAMLFYGACLSVKNPNKGREYFERAGKIIKEHKFFFIIKRDSELLYPLLRRAKNEKLIRITEGFFGIPHINIKTLGEFRIFIEGKDLTRKIFRRKKEKEIFEFIVSKAPRSVQIDEILDVFFNSDASKKSRHNLFTLLSMTRKSFENVGIYEVILKSGESYKINLNKIKIDFIEFENYAKTGLKNEDKENLKKAVELYTNDFLIDLPYEDWPIMKREILLGKYLSSLSALAQIARGEEKIEYLKRIIEKDPMNDDAALEIMKTLISMGKGKDAIAFFKNYEKNLSQQYQLKPSKTLISLYRNLAK